MVKESFGQRLARLRKEKELTQNNIADKVGVSTQAVSKWENDLASPDIDVILKLSDIFEITVDELLGKEKHVTSFNEKKPTKKDIDKMFFRITVHDEEEGADVNLNLPLSLVKIFVNKENGKLNIISGNKNLENIDFKALIEMVEEGAFGELLTVETENGTKVRIVVE